MERIKALAVGLAVHYGTRDPYELCENMGIAVLSADLPPNISGFFTSLRGMRVILLNSGIEEEPRRRVVCAHELGHAVLHEGQNSLFMRENTGFVIARYEKEADLFAGYLLLDDATVNDCRCNGWTSGQIGRFTGLSEPVVEYCLSER